MALETPGLSLSFPSSADYSTGTAKGKFVKLASSGGDPVLTRAGTAGEQVHGVCQNSPAAGEAMTFVQTGRVIVNAVGTNNTPAGAAIAPGDPVTTNANGQAVKANVTGDVVAGYALSTLASGATGDISVLLVPTVGVPTIA